MGRKLFITFSASFAPRWTTMFPFIKPDFFGGRVHTFKIINTTMTNQTFEPACFYREPIHHIATKGSTRTAYAILVDIGKFFDIISSFHKVFVTFTTPVAGNFIDILLAKTRAAPWVGQCNNITPCGPGLWIPAITPTIFPSTLGPAMNQKGDRPFLRWIKPRGF